MNLERLYLDYNATSPLSHSVIDWMKSGDVLFANPASQHSSGKASRKLINEGRTAIYQAFGKSEKDTKLFFHSGATEAFLTFTYSFSELARLKGGELLVCYSRIDHPAVANLSERYWGPHVKFLELVHNDDLTYNHTKNLEIIKDKKDNNPDLVVLYHHLWVHNETGFVSPLEELLPFKNIPDLYIHVDCVQAPGKIPEWQNLSVGDVWSFSAHKFGAFKGIGFSFFKKDLPFSALVLGGGQQQGLRSGTENPQGVKSIALALNDLKAFDVKANTKKREELENFIEGELRGIGGVLKGPRRNANTIYFYLNRLTSDIALALFDLNGLMISAGSACSSGAAKDSLVLLQLGKKEVAKNGLRLSFGFHLSDEELSKIKTLFHQTIERVKKN
ncbi:cysteine desulfurase family protein [Peredibacter starrii]|uniref:Aminotransferase class V-fold PLP-dependent enzyme n=1 Tax=Peredibacter starrii TaxID=28202 RepID=A0AAX4HKG2_9BACT|nr:aminotransferase class V-fold PLP-dependent enzyme [Peredibacter starrii]WPU63698.1 aminotransferase class V-fold PLP-dependent enzyme [Peredibacter starrii]